MKNLLSTAALALCLPTAALASDVHVTIESAGSGTVNAVVGQQVDYEIYVELSDALNQGLALCIFDLAFDGGALAQTNAAAGAEQLNFASPLGLSNPAGFGGTPDAGMLRQVGGAQNTIKNVFAPQPSGSVIADLAKPGARLLFASGSLTAPALAGTYHLDVSNLIANVIRQGETGTGTFWAVDPAQPGTLSGLVINVADCAPTIYCTAKVNSQGCTPAIGLSGSATVSGADDLHITASSVLNRKFGQMFWSQAAASIPFQGGTLCVAGPHRRTPVQVSGGSATGEDCSGSFDYAFTQSYMASQALGVGSTVYAQYFYRDNNNLDGTGYGLTDAVGFTICP